jgi:hypothetical protein
MTRGPAKTFWPSGSSISSTPLLRVNVPENALALSPRRMLGATCGTPPERHSNVPDPVIRPERTVSFPPPVSITSGYLSKSMSADSRAVCQPKVVGPVSRKAPTSPNVSPGFQSLRGPESVAAERMHSATGTSITLESQKRACAPSIISDHQMRSVSGE